jgi:DNA-binding MarR family transcriptional regulator
MDLGALGDEVEHDLLRFRGVGGSNDMDPVRFERGGGPLHAGVVGDRPEPAADLPIEVGFDFGDQGKLPFGVFARYDCGCKYPTPPWLHMQVPPETELSRLVDRLAAAALPDGRTVGAWRALLQAHATLTRQLGTDLERATGLALADFDVLAQLAYAGGQLRMTELANRALISRSGMTRRVARLVDDGYVGRADADGDGRGVVIALTDAGVARLTETVPVHARGVADYFVSRLDDDELTILERALDKVTIDCGFG